MILMSNCLAVFEKSLSIGSIGSYIHWVNQLPMLSAEEEAELVARLAQKNDLEAARKLILSHLRLVVKVARGYDGYGLQNSDLIQEGNIGLMKAVKRFKPEFGVRLVTYALHWIRAEIQEFVIKNWKIVKIATTKAQRKIFHNLRKLTQSNQLSESEIKFVAEELNVSHADVTQMSQRIFSKDERFDPPCNSSYDNDEHAPSSPSEYLEDHSTNPSDVLELQDQNKNIMQGLYKGIQTLDERSQDIIRHRWLHQEKLTLHQLAEKYSISAERVRQIEKNAFQSLHQFLTPSSQY